jgi:hypothetical protein
MTQEERAALARNLPRATALDLYRLEYVVRALYSKPTRALAIQVHLNMGVMVRFFNRNSGTFHSGRIVAMQDHTMTIDEPKLNMRPQNRKSRSSPSRGHRPASRTSSGPTSRSVTASPSMTATTYRSPERSTASIRRPLRPRRTTERAAGASRPRYVTTWSTSEVGGAPAVILSTSENLTRQAWGFGDGYGAGTIAWPVVS